MARRWNRPCRVLWLDMETTGIESERCAVIQMSGYVAVNGNVKETFNYFMSPFPGAYIDEEALEVHGRKPREIKKYPDHEAVMRTFITMLKNYVDPKKPSEKFTVAGYFVKFDTDFLRQYMKYIGENYGYYFKSVNLDVSSFVALVACLEGLYLKNYKLKTVCDYFDIPLDPHDSMDDIKATRQLFKKLYQYIKESEKP